jgi:hypothetical protein
MAGALIYSCPKSLEWVSVNPLERLSATSLNLHAAFNRALRLLGLVDRNDPLTELIAREVIEIGATGVRDSVEICKIAIRRLRIS